jgi:hypothetical protein
MGKDRCVGPFTHDAIVSYRIFGPRGCVAPSICPIARAPMSGSLKAAGSGLSRAWSVATKHVPAFTGGKVRGILCAQKQ